MKTTLNLDDDLVRSAKQRAVATDQNLTAMVETALRRLLAEERRAAKPYRFNAKPVKGKTLPGVDITDRDALYDRMEGRA